MTTQKRQHAFAGPKPPAVPRRIRGRTAAFTLIELLIVVGIIALLIALAVIGFRTVGGASKARLTNNQLENCKSLLNEYELTSQVAGLFPTPPVAAGHWVVPLPAPTDINTLTCYTVTAKPSTAGEMSLREDTARVIARLRSVSKNRESLEKMSPDRISGTSFTSVAGLPAGNAAVLLDGSGNPIYFVPGGGLAGVRSGYNGGDRTMDSGYDKVYTAAAPLRAPDRRPFWVSPGPDGDLTTGDDNQYSFGE